MWPPQPRTRSPEQGNAPARLLAAEKHKWVHQPELLLVFKRTRTISIMTSFTVEIQLLQGSISLGWIFSAVATHGELSCRTTISLMLVPAQGTRSMCSGVRGGDKMCKVGCHTGAMALGSALLWLVLFLQLCPSCLVPTSPSCVPHPQSSPRCPTQTGARRVTLSPCQPLVRWGR